MGFEATLDVPWTIPPNWAPDMHETLSWSTDVMQASATAVTQHRALRASPRRSFSFEVLADSQERRAADMLLAGHSGTWLLPIWPDVQWLAAPLLGGVAEVPCVTAGYDFVPGGKALLYAGVNTWEIVGVDTVEVDHLALGAPTVATYPTGSRLYPLRLVRVQDGAEERLLSDHGSRRSIVFDVAEPCDWPVLASPTTYLDHLVLDVRPDESTDPVSSHSRLLQTVDYGTSLPVVHDLPGLSLRAQQSTWKLVGRAERAWFRSLLYTLDGRRVPIWVPSFASDLLPVAPIAGNSIALEIEWAGYTRFGLGKPNRKDLRIELKDGTVLYRRIAAAAITGTTETLALDAALASTSIAPESIRQISFMALCTLASDEIEIEHVADQNGLARATTGWQAVVPDV